MHRSFSTATMPPPARGRASRLHTGRPRLLICSAHASYLGTHLNPSAGCTIVLSRDLAVQGVLPGWVLALFADGAIVYQRSQVHFAPTHYAELFLHDDPHHRDVQIYP